MSGKKDLLKQNMNRGSAVNNLVPPSASVSSAADPGIIPEKEKKEKDVHCNFVIPATYHKTLKRMAIDNDSNLKTELMNALDLYFKANNVDLI